MNPDTPTNLVQMKSSRLREKFTAMRTASTHVVFLGLLLAPAAISAQTKVSADQSPLITIVSPKFNDVLPYGNVGVRAQLRADELPETFTATLNGADVGDWFNAPAACTSGSPCNLQATLPENLLLPGANVLALAVEAEGGAASEARVQFEYTGGAQATGDSIRHLVPSVRLNANYLRPGSDPADIRNWEIQVGPGPDFPQRIYSAENAGCTATDSFMAVVLDKTTLDPDSSVGGGTNHPGQACFTAPAQVTSFLKSLTKGQLVIGSSFFGLVRNIDTTAAGGTNYSKSGAPLPRYYTFFGAVGAREGTAYESYHPTRVGRGWVPPFVGNLALNNLQQYFFVPSAFETMEVIPNKRIYPVVIGDEGYFTYWPQESPGGFVLLTFDRRLGTVIMLKNYITSVGNKNYKVETPELISALTSASPDLMVVLTSFGQPFASPKDVDPALAGIIDRLGGSGELMTRLGERGNNGIPAGYTLITSSDPDFINTPDMVIEETTLFPNQTGALKALLGKDRNNLWSVVSLLPDRANSNSTTQLSSFDWQTVGFQPAQDWPAWTPNQQKAYIDLTSPHYPSVRESLGCSADVCPPIRSYYSGVVGGGGSAALRIPYTGLSYAPNGDYSPQDFHVVVTQLRREQGYLGNVQAIYNQFNDVTGAAQGSLQSELAKVARNFDAGLAQRNRSAATTATQLGIAAGFMSLFSSAPGLGPAASALSGILKAQASLYATPGSLPEEYNITLNSLRDGTSALGLRLASSTNSLFTGIVTDWGKLQTIGGGYGAQRAPWYMCFNCKDSNIPSAAIPLMAAGAKRDFYLRLLPTVYTVDQYRGKTSSQYQKFGYWVLTSNGSRICHHPYQSAPSATAVIFNTPGQTNQYDIGLLVQTNYTTNAQGYKEVHYPADSLLNDLFTLPTMNGDGTLGGGAGFSIDSLFTSISGRPLPVRQAFATNPACGPQ